MVASDLLIEPRPLSKQSDGEQVAEVLQSVSLNENDGGRGLADNGAPASIKEGKHLKTREVASRYKAATVSSANSAAIAALRFQSPTRGRSQSPSFGRRSLDAVSKTPPPPDKRPTSAERRRPGPWPASACENRTPASQTAANSARSVARRLAVRSLSSSFQSDVSVCSSSNDEQPCLKAGVHRNGEGGRASSTPENGKSWNASTKVTEAKVTTLRKKSPLRRAYQPNEQSENSKHLSNGQIAKPAMRRCHSMGNGQTKSILSRSMDFGFSRDDSRRKDVTSLLGRSPLRVDAAASNGHILSRSANEGPNPKVIRRVQSDSGDETFSRTNDTAEGSLSLANSLEDNGSDTESSSSGGLSVAMSAVNVRPKATAVPARFWQDAASLASMRRLKVPGPIYSMTPLRATQSGHSTPQHPSSPSSQARPMQNLSPKRGSASPTKTRAGHPILLSQLSLNSRHSNLPGLFSLNFETRKNKQTIGHQDDAHDLRILHSRWLQWRFVNAQTKRAMSIQAGKAEVLLHNCFLRTSDLWMSVSSKQIERNKFRQADKLGSVLAASAGELDEWGILQPEHGSTLTGLTNALEATVVRVPVIGGPKIDILAIKENFLSAMEIMKGLDASISTFLQKAEVTECLLTELAKLITDEKSSLLECADLLTAAAVLEMEERSLRAGLLQHSQEIGFPEWA